MLKNMLNLPSPTPRVDLMKAFDKKFQIPKLSSRPKSEAEDQSSHPRSAPTTPSHPMAPSPTMEYSQFSHNQPQKFFSNVQQQKFVEPQMQKKLYKSASSEQLYEENNRMSPLDTFRPSDADFQAFLRAQAKNNEMSMGMMEMQGNQQRGNSNLFDADLDFIGND